MDPNAGRFTTDEAEIALHALTRRLGPGEIDRDLGTFAVDLDSPPVPRPPPEAPSQ